MGVLQVINDDWNVAFVFFVASVCDDVGVFKLINDDGNATFVSIFTGMCNDVGVFWSSMMTGMFRVY